MRFRFKNERRLFGEDKWGVPQTDFTPDNDNFTRLFEHFAGREDWLNRMERIANAIEDEIQADAEDAENAANDRAYYRASYNSEVSRYLEDMR